MCGELCFLFHTLSIDERDCCRLFATKDYYFISHEYVVCVCAYNDFGQQHLAPMTPAITATGYGADCSSVGNAQHGRQPNAQWKQKLKLYVVMCVPFGRLASRWQRLGRHDWAVMGELTFLYI